MSLIVDVSQLARWQGKLTGIPREMYELSFRFYETNPETVFVVWDGEQRIFREISFESILESRKQASQTHAAVPVEEVKSGALRSFYDSSPEVVKKPLRKLKSALKAQTSDAAIVNDDSITFASGDSLFVAWGEWGDASYRTALASCVKQGVSLYQVANDMLPVVTPQYSSHSTEALDAYVREVYPLCTKIIAISEHTKRDVVSWLKDHGLKTPPVEVIRLGEDFQKLTPKMPTDVFFAKKTPYIVCVGTIESRKNHTLLYYTYKLAAERGIKLPKLVIVGRRGWLTENIYDLMTIDPEVKDKFLFLHDASDEELSWLYDHSLFSIYPSFYEGWGLPIAESIANGVPCACSNTSSMPEVAGDLVTYFSPASSDECLAAIVHLLDDDTRKKAKARLATYQPSGWDQTFKQLTKIMGVNHD